MNIILYVIIFIIIAIIFLIIAGISIYYIEKSLNKSVSPELYNGFRVSKTDTKEVNGQLAGVNVDETGKVQAFYGKIKEVMPTASKKTGIKIYYNVPRPE